ncbi:hypothetical protein ACFWY6_10825 [Streptomyces sp. NPDC059037]|uniref:hypothetical protein n=1 Tax=Streptomyces sp. NPDC059037 TaxID=3346710 RepID=UPI00369DD584
MWATAQATALLGERDEDVVPEYGSLAWLRLRPSDPLRAVAVLRAAELWRRHRAYEVWLDGLDADEWFREITADANAYAASIAGALARRRTAAEMRVAQSRRRPPHRLVATPGWPPIRVPGEPGRYLKHPGAAA